MQWRQRNREWICCVPNWAISNWPKRHICCSRWLNYFWIDPTYEVCLIWYHDTIRTEEKGDNIYRVNRRFGICISTKWGKVRHFGYTLTQKHDVVYDLACVHSRKGRLSFSHSPISFKPLEIRIFLYSEWQKIKRVIIQDFECNLHLPARPPCGQFYS